MGILEKFFRKHKDNTEEFSSLQMSEDSSASYIKNSVPAEIDTEVMDATKDNSPIEFEDAVSSEVEDEVLNEAEDNILIENPTITYDEIQESEHNSLSQEETASNTDITTEKTMEILENPSVPLQTFEQPDELFQSSSSIDENSADEKSLISEFEAEGTISVDEEIRECSEKSALQTVAEPPTATPGRPEEIDIPKEYIFPPLDLLKEPSHTEDQLQAQEISETIDKLQQVFDSFNIGAHVSNVYHGPSITTYELTLDSKTKVSQVLNLINDLKLNLATTDLCIEAPIPGKSSIGIEISNKTNSTVYLREILESKEFREHPSNLAFVVGKDIFGKPMVEDIAKLPHLLVAGATGSGKSIFIHSIIMSLLYKVKPEEVKLILIDPKVVEFSVYNGIPHLLIPVVTDPKKASGVLNWAVAEMTGRYQKFAEYNTRDLVGYNKKVEAIRDILDKDKPEKMPQIIIIVDELADLIMVDPGDVEHAICCLAQLARAAGIHLIVTTQRPSASIITKSINECIQSRVAFHVPSMMDSRMIIGINNANKLFESGDMLFYSQNHKSPIRVQGAFVSDAEISNVVEFLIIENGISRGNVDIECKITPAKSMEGSYSSGESDIDEYFEKAGRFIIEKDKASIGMLQRLLKIGFNRAAKIMDQLADAGVVGPEEDTKPRKILMSMEEFENYMYRKGSRS